MDADRAMTSQKLKHRISVYVTERDLTAIRRASEKLGVAISEFIRVSAVERARRELRAIGHLDLTPDEWRAFATVLDRPAKRVPQLRRLFREASILERP
jgi:uncharacterized protein (DUF1778 family)